MAGKAKIPHRWMATKGTPKISQFDSWEGRECAIVTWHGRLRAGGWDPGLQISIQQISPLPTATGEVRKIVQETFSACLPPPSQSSWVVSKRSISQEAFRGLTLGRTWLSQSWVFHACFFSELRTHPEPQEIDGLTEIKSSMGYRLSINTWKNVRPHHRAQNCKLKQDTIFLAYKICKDWHESDNTLRWQGHCEMGTLRHYRGSINCFQEAI